MRVRESWPSHHQVWEWAFDMEFDKDVTPLEQVAFWLCVDTEEVLRMYLSYVGTFRQAKPFAPTNRNNMAQGWDQFFLWLADAVDGAPAWLHDETLRHWIVQKDLWDNESPFTQTRIDMKYALLKRWGRFSDSDNEPMELP